MIRLRSDRYYEPGTEKWSDYEKRAVHVEQERATMGSMRAAQVASAQERPGKGRGGGNRNRGSMNSPTDTPSRSPSPVPSYSQIPYPESITPSTRD